MQKIYIVPQRIEKDSSKQICILYHYNFVDICNFIIHVYKQQQNIDSLSSKGSFNNFSPGFAYDSFCRWGIWARAAYVSMRVYFTS